MATTVSYHPQFDKKLERLERKYPRASDEVLNLIDRLEDGARPGDRIPGVGYTVYKARLPNRTARRDKSAGFRVIYYAQVSDRIPCSPSTR